MAKTVEPKRSWARVTPEEAVAIRQEVPDAH
jgi:hypothetical protein